MDTVEAQRGLSVCYNRLGDICEAEGDLSGARELYLKCLEICRTLAERTDTIETQRDISICYEKLGNICKAEDDISAAREWYLKELEICRTLAASTDIVSITYTIETMSSDISTMKP